MLRTFDLNKPFNLHLNPPSSDSKYPIITTDFYLTNIEPGEWILPILPTNNEKATSNAAAATSNPPPEIPVDPLQPGKIRLHSWQLYAPEAPVLDPRGKKVTSTLDLADTFHELYLKAPQTMINKKNLHQMAEGKDEQPTNPSKQLSDSETLDEEPINPILKTSV